MPRNNWLWLMPLVACLWQPTALAAPAATKTYALIIGVNQPNEAGLAPLRFADDDALKYTALLRTLGAQTLTLSDPDANTQRLFEEAHALKPPTWKEFDAATTWLKQRVADDRAASEATVVYFIYAGHGARDEQTQEGFLTLADARLDASRLFASLVDKVNADTFHVIVDACNSQFLTEARGPGGQRRALSPFAREVARRALDRRVGLMFATSSMTQTFEYEGFAAGVFSHLVRSGLAGAADVDLDGLVTYEELQRFVALAAEPIANELYRPRVHALPPEHTRTLADLRSALHNQIFVSGTATSAHHAIEDRNGIRVLDFHNAQGQAVHLVWPQNASTLYVFDDDSDTEVQLSRVDGVVNLAAFSPQQRRTSARGAADHAFRSLFALPFSAQKLAAIDLRDQAVAEPLPPAPRQPTPPLAKAAFWTAGALTAASVLSFGAAYVTLHEADARTDQARADKLNDRAHTLQWAAAIGLGLAAGAATTGWMLLALPRAADNAHMDGVAFALSGRW
ncbi:MAG: caspase family protein [Deltaproteobacteria bacterium]|nr:caspase family protein [Deltaproteobacteria bacterium]